MSKKTILFVGALSLLAAFSLSSYAKVTKREDAPTTVTSGLEVKKVHTDSNYKKDGSGDWLKPNVSYQFRTTNGKWCKVKLDKENSEFLNCKPSAYVSTFANNRGEWGEPGIVIEALGEGGWSCQIRYTFEWQK